MDRIIDDVSVLAIEDCLVSKLPLLFTPSMILDLDEGEVTSLAGESENTAAERTKIAEKLKILEFG